MHQILLIAAGGAVGASLRYLLGLLSHKLPVNSSIVTGSVLANAAGSFCAGFILGMTISTSFGSSPGYLFFSVGLIGSLSTYSTFILEMLILERTKSYTQLTVYLLLQLGGVLIITYAGFWIYKQLFGGM